MREKRLPPRCQPHDRRTARSGPILVCVWRPVGMHLLGAGHPGGRGCLPDAHLPDLKKPEPSVPTRLSVTIALATALLLTSCGGGSDDAGGGSSGDVLRVATEGTYAPF